VEDYENDDGTGMRGITEERRGVVDGWGVEVAEQRAESRAEHDGTESSQENEHRRTESRA
jgi:hypothetical protein